MEDTAVATIRSVAGHTPRPEATPLHPHPERCSTPLESEMTLTCSAVDSLLPLAHTRPAFRRDALRMLGACLRHPVTRAIQDNALRFDPPDWATGHAASSRLARLLSGALIRVITERSLPFEPAPSWDCAHPALDRIFGIDLAITSSMPLRWSGCRTRR